jgi:putative transposase
MNQLPVEHIKNPTAIDLHKELNKLKRTDYPWMYDVSKCAPQETLRDLDEAFTNFFKKRAGYPSRKSKKNGVGSFRLTGSIKVSFNNIKMPRLGRIRIKERNYLPIDAHILSVTVSEKAQHWFVSLAVEEEIEIPINTGGIVGTDLGINAMATDSDGKKFENPKALNRFTRHQREVSRQKKGSTNRRKSVRRLSRTHLRISDIRKDALHKVTTKLAKTKSVIVIEDLNVSGMMKNHSLARAIGDVGMGEFRRQLEYKTKWYGSQLIIAPRFYPSSKLCSGCGHIKDNLKLSDRIYICDVCHLRIDRDLNAAINLSRLAVSSTESINACLRREVTDGREAGQCPSVIQELNAIEGRDVLNG